MTPHTPTVPPVFKARWPVATGITFYHHTIIEEPFFAGYKTRIEAGMGMGYRAAEKKMVSAIVFGLPGTGKTVFPSVLAARLKKDHNLPFSLVVVSSSMLVGELHQARDIIAEIEKIDYFVDNYGPLIIMLDELDMLSPDRTRMPERATLVSWLQGKLNGGFLKIAKYGVLILGITNKLLDIDDAVRTRFTYQMDFPLPDRHAILEMLNAFEIPNAQLVEERLRLGIGGEFVDGRSVIRACEQITPEDKIGRNVEEIVSLLRAHGVVPCEKDVVDEFQRRYKSYLDNSKFMIEYWQSEYKKYKQKGIALQQSGKTTSS